MAELVRTALKRNYKIFGYERHEKIAGKDRDEIQADNIINYLEKSEAEKIIIYCGWYHAIESNDLKRGKSFWLAKYLKDETGIDPLTIYQDNFTEKTIENEHPVLQKKVFDEPAVFVNNKGEIVQLSEQVDIELVHPKTNYLNGRPSWLYQNEEYKNYFLDNKTVTLKYPFFMKAFNLGEHENGVPIDIVELKYKFDNKPLVLKKGRYVIHLANKKELQEFEIIVE